MSEGNPVGKAIHETATMVSVVKAETRKRKNWGYIRISALKEWAESQSWPGNVIPNTDEDLARRFFGVRLDAPVIQGTQAGLELYAVWRKVDLPTIADAEPDFDEKTNEAIDVSDTERPPPPKE